MQERIEPKQTPLPTIDYFDAFHVDPTASVDELRKKCAALLKEFHPDTGRLAGKVSRADFDFAVQALADLRSLSKDPDAFAEYRKIMQGKRKPSAQVEQQDAPPLFHREGDFYIGKTHVRPVRGGALISGGHKFYKVVSPFTGEVMGSKAFVRLHEVGGMLVGTYTVGLGRRETLVDKHTGEAYGQSFGRIFMKGTHLCGESFGSIYHITDPQFGTVANHVVDVEA